MPLLVVLFLISFISLQVHGEEVQISGQFTFGEGGSGDHDVAQESSLFALPSMRIAREYLRRQAEKERQESFKS